MEYLGVAADVRAELDREVRGALLVVVEEEHVFNEARLEEGGELRIGAVRYHVCGPRARAPRLGAGQASAVGVDLRACSGVRCGWWCGGGGGGGGVTSASVSAGGDDNIKSERARLVALRHLYLRSAHHMVTR